MSDDCVRNLSEQFLGDSSLTEELDDAVAQRLIDWSLMVVRRLCEASQGMEATAAMEYLDSASGKLRRVVRRTADLCGTAASLTPEEAAELFGRIMEAAAGVPVLRASAPGDALLMARTIQMQTPGDSLSLFLNTIFQVEGGV